MSQTILAFGALLMAMFFSLGQNRSMINSYNDMVQDELEIMASGMALQVMEHVASKPFDAATANADFQARNLNVNNLAAWPFSGGGTFDQAQDLDDFHNIVTESIEFDASGTQVPFDVDIYVHYVDTNNNHSSTRTATKEVVVTIRNDRYRTPLVQLKRTFSP